MPGYLSFVVKGTLLQAMRAAQEHRIHWNNRGTMARVGWVHAILSDSVTLCTANTPENLERLARWFCEPGSAPYAAGSCLLYSEHDTEYAWQTPGEDDPDWLVLSIEDKGPGEFYRWHVTGENSSACQPYGAEFDDRVPDVTDRRYAPHPRATPEVRAALASAKQARASGDLR